MMRTTPFLLLALLAFAPTALAQEAEPPPEYQALIQEALTESSNGNWADARAAFRQAHEVFPNARTERGIGMVSFEMRDYVDSVRHLRRALENPTRPLTEAQQTETQALLERALGRVARFSLMELPEGAELTVDGRAVEPEDDGTLMLPIGEHSVAVLGARRWESTIPVRGGEQGPLPMRFDEPEPEVGTGTPPPRVITPDPEPSGPPDGALALTLGGVVVLVAGVAVLTAGLVEYARAESSTTATEWSEVSGSYEITAPLQGIGYALIGVGAAITIGGGVWIASDDGGGGGAGARLRIGGTF